MLLGDPLRWQKGLDWVSGAQSLVLIVRNLLRNPRQVTYPPWGLNSSSVNRNNKSLTRIHLMVTSENKCEDTTREGRVLFGGFVASRWVMIVMVLCVTPVWTTLPLQLKQEKVSPCAFFLPLPKPTVFPSLVAGWESESKRTPSPCALKRIYSFKWSSSLTSSFFSFSFSPVILPHDTPEKKGPFSYWRTQEIWIAPASCTPPKNKLFNDKKMLQTFWVPNTFHRK